MSNVYIVVFRGHHLHSDEQSENLGIYTTRTLAIEAGRSACHHDDDEYTIVEYGLNRPDNGKAIWGSVCDANLNDIRQFFAQYWPTGFPS